MANYLEHRKDEYAFGFYGHTVIAILDVLSKNRSVKYIYLENG